VTRIGFVIIGLGIALIAARVLDWVNTESADILSVLAIVIGALVVAVDGERSPRTPS
jgi:NhaP-type Na+/H+ or K+/H+ antiporter